MLSDLIEKEKGYRNVENTSDNESNNEESSSDIENQEEEEEEEVASENGVETEGTQESDNDLLAIFTVKSNDSVSFSFLFPSFLFFVKDQIASFQLKQIVEFLN